MAEIRSFRDLKVYKQAVIQAREIFRVTKSFPPEERYALTDQIRRSSRAVAAMIAEAWARRPYPAAFINKLNEALGEAMETQSWLDHAAGCRYISRPDYQTHDAAWQSIGAMLQGMTQQSHSFCRTASR